MRLHPKSNDLSEPIRSNVVRLLDSRLTDCIDLQRQTKQAPCNLKGPSPSLHRLFDDINEEVEQNVDTIANRAAQLGVATGGRTRCVALESSQRESPLSLIADRDQVTALADTLASFRKNVRRAIGQSTEFGDNHTANTLTRVSRAVDKWLWMVQAHLQEG